MNRPALIFLLSLSINLAYIFFLAPPVLVYDEGTYAVMVRELGRDPGQIIPTVAGEPVEYKPPLLIWASLPFHYLLQNLPIEAEPAYRIPSAVFGALSAALVYLIAKSLYDGKVGLTASLLFLSAPPIIFSSTLTMMESFSILLLLSSIYFYIRERIALGAMFLGMLVLTKWLYVISPMLFVVLYFLKKPKLKCAALSFIAVPLAILFYLAASSVFGSIDNVLYTLLADASRAQPFSLFIFLANNLLLLNYGFPISVFFLVFVYAKRKELWEEKHLVLTGLLVFAATFSNKFLPWYSSISLPAMIIFVAVRARESGKLANFLLAVLIILNFWSMFFFPLTYQNIETRDIAEFSKGKSVTFYMTKTLFLTWSHINEHYRGTENARLLLEQQNVGFFFYRFDDCSDYDSVSAAFAQFNETPGCDDYLVVDSAAPVPSCYDLLWNTSRYWVYSTKE